MSTQVESGRTSSNPEMIEHNIIDIQCHDPQNPDFPCPICRGLGVVKANVPVDDARFGKLFRCPNNPISEDYERQERLLKMSNLDAHSDKTFENFDADYHSSLQDAYDKAFQYSQNPEGWVIFEGKYGCGKTHLAAAIGNEVVKHGNRVLFLTTPDLLDHLRSTFNPRSEVQYDELFEKVKSIYLLILDDLGVENPSPWAQEKLYQILNHRYTRRLPTVITTNVNIDKLDPRISSRIQDINLVQPVNITSPDYRKSFEFDQNREVSDYQYSVVTTKLYSKMTFASFEMVGNTADDINNLSKAINAVRDFIDISEKLIRNQPVSGEPWLLLMGGYGTGKTHLAAAAAGVLSKNLPTTKVVFVEATDLLDHFRTTFNPESTIRLDDAFVNVSRAGILILDNLNTQNTSSWAREKLFQILEYRYIHGSPTLITTSQQLGQLDPRFQSRLADVRICRRFALSVPSYSDRIKKSYRRR